MLGRAIPNGGRECSGWCFLGHKKDGALHFAGSKMSHFRLPLAGAPQPAALAGIGVRLGASKKISKEKPGSRALDK